MTDSRAPSRKRRFRLASPATLVVLAVVIVAAFGICHGMGMRADTPALFATSARDGSAVTSAIVYVALYLAAVVLAPILAIAAAIMKAVQWTLARRAGAEPAASP